MTAGAIPSTKNDRVRVNASDSSAGFLENKLESSDGSVGISVSSCGCSLDLTVEGASDADAWTKYSIDFDDAELSTGTNDVSFTISTGHATGTTIVHTRKKQSSSWGGGSITDTYVQVGYNTSWDTAWRLNSSTIPGRGSSESPYYDVLCTGDIEVRFTFTGGVDTDLTSGGVDIWIKTAVLS